LPIFAFCAVASVLDPEVALDADAAEDDAAEEDAGAEELELLLLVLELDDVDVLDVLESELHAAMRRTAPNRRKHARFMQGRTAAEARGIARSPEFR
jgi:hypothetical protein